MNYDNFKLALTRPIFLNRILTQCDNTREITETDLVKLLNKKNHKLEYCAYTALMEAELNPEDIEYYNEDEESVVVKLTSKSLAKKVKDTFNKEIIRIGIVFYKVHVKVDNSYVIVSIEVDHELGENEKLC